MDMVMGKPACNIVGASILSAIKADHVQAWSRIGMDQAVHLDMQTSAGHG
jgi:hypothetical protein